LISAELGAKDSHYFIKKLFCSNIILMAEINDKILKHLAELARIEIDPRTYNVGEGVDPKKETKFLSDFKSILGHFEELKSLNTSGVTPMTGGTNLKNITREDDFNENNDRGKGVQSFPEAKSGYLKVPPVFE
jgi:aspartyl/glutamyl-tRNA(Asn/Gln) amidotransferase C subunit